MKHIVCGTKRPVRAVDDINDPGADGFISTLEILYIVLGFLPTLIGFYFTKNGWEYS